MGGYGGCADRRGGDKPQEAGGREGVSEGGQQEHRRILNTAGTHPWVPLCWDEHSLSVGQLSTGLSQAAEKVLNGSLVSGAKQVPFGC